MRTIYSEQHRLRDAKTELYGGELVQPFERPSRAETVLKVVRESDLGEISAPEAFSLEPVLAVHDADYIAFLETAWQEWQDAGYAGEVIPSVWPARRMQTRVPRFIDGKVGYYAMAAETSISEGTWAAALSSKDVALTGAKALLEGGARCIFPVPPSRSPRRAGYVWRLLFPQQCGHRGTIPA